MSRDPQNPYILTRSGIRFYPLAPRVVDINIEDVAFALSNITRYGGHVDFLSVAEHSVLVSEQVEEAMRVDRQHNTDVMRGALFGLLHDAAEAYPPGDILGPVKRLPAFAGVLAVQHQIERCVEEAFGLNYSSVIVREVVRAADEWLLIRESAVLRKCHEDEAQRLKARGEVLRERGFGSAGIRCLNPERARKAFLARYDDLTTELRRHET